MSVVTLDEGVTVVLMVGVGVLTTAALYVGLVGMLGGFYIVRCASCSHWTFPPTGRGIPVRAAAIRRSCIHCVPSVTRGSLPRRGYRAEPGYRIR